MYSRYFIKCVCFTGDSASPGADAVFVRHTLQGVPLITRPRERGAAAGFRRGGALLPRVVREAVLLQQLAQRLGSVLAVSSGMLIGNKAAPAAAAQLVRHPISVTLETIPILEETGRV